MNRRELIALVGGAAVWPAAGQTQHAERLRRVGILTGLAEGQVGGQPVSALKGRLRELGWVEGQNVSFEFRVTSGQPGLIRKFAAELVALRFDVIVSAGAPNVVALQNETSTIPIVFVFVSDPIGMGVVKDMARPGGNITGFAAFEPSLGGKWLELLKECAPGVTRTAIIYNPETAPNSPVFIESAQSAGATLGVSVALAPIRDDVEVERVISELGRVPGGGLIQVPDPFTSARPQLLAAAAIGSGVALVSPFRWIANAGGLVSYGIDAAEQNRQAAEYVDRILRGARPSDLPVQRPTKFELVINLKTAKALGLTILPMLLARADEIID